MAISSDWAINRLDSVQSYRLFSISVCVCVCVCVCEGKGKGKGRMIRPDYEGHSGIPGRWNGLLPVEAPLFHPVRCVSLDILN